MSAPGGGKPVAGETDFDSMSHAQLFALLKSANKDSVNDLSEKLASIAKTVTTIGDHLKAHVGALRWEGKGGDAFREWGNQTANATLKLAEYADSASRLMHPVSQGIVQAHANMPALSLTTGAQSDLHLATERMKKSDSPSFEKSAMLASSRIEGTRSDAADQLRILASTYVHTGSQINALKPPTFPPPANQLGSKWIDPNTHYDAHSTSSGSSGPVVTGSGRRTQHYSANDGDASKAIQEDSGGRGLDGPGGGAHALPVSVPPARDAHMEIDSTAPPLTQPAVHTAAFAPPTTNEVPKGTGTPFGVLPPTFGAAGSGLPAFNEGFGDSGPIGRQSGATFGGRLPRFASTGELPGSTQAGRAPLPRENGIVGGKPVQSPNGRPTARLPRGMVVGGEESGNGANGRPAMGRGTSGMRMGGEGAAGAGRNGLVGGRRLASETGGVVGRPGQPGKLGTRPFTEGGSGLVRGESEGAEETSGRQSGQGGRSGTMPRGTTGSRRRRDGDGGRDRPDYLTEEDETWQQGNRRVVPPVID
ncbi:WXG100 family type VII secretion target [Streptomyces sp. NBC_01497]|uniref:WXG100 family type VII secretion target n=1 Tax=Streptomyces sp. NBC_01497 TaxID=2903885 RepID=UPI002E3792A0|nr:hypothetical protein [Streptomyces sp. NBC_01497]